MTKKIVVLAMVTSILISACQINPKKGNEANKKTVAMEIEDKARMTNIPFTVAKNYFVKNTVKKLDNPKIKTVSKFNEVFGMATTMGNDGKPTEIDFQKKYVIAVVLPETDLMTTINPVSLQKNGSGKIILIYRKTVGQKQTYTISPNFIIIVDKSENGSIELREEK